MDMADADQQQQTPQKRVHSSKSRGMSRGRSASLAAPAANSGLRDVSMSNKALQLADKAQRRMNKMAKIGEADRCGAGLLSACRCACVEGSCCICVWLRLWLCSLECCAERGAVRVLLSCCVLLQDDTDQDAEAPVQRQAAKGQDRQALRCCWGCGSRVGVLV